MLSKALCTLLFAGFTKIPQQAGRVMKLTATLILVACLTAGANGFSQAVTLKVRQAPLATVFKEVEKQTGYSFLYAEDLPSKAKPVSLDIANVPLNEALKSIFAGQPFTYRVISTVIIVNTKDVATLNREYAPPLPIDVKGRVVNESGEPVIATISVKGTTRAVSTDNNGVFELKDIDGNATLVISGVNFETYEIKLGGSSDLGTLTVKAKIVEGDDVVVKVNTGYQTLPKERATGSFVQIDNQLLNRRVSTDILSRLEDVTSGLIFNRSGNNPITIRGQNTIYGNATPLVVIDNFPFVGDFSTTNPLNTINPNDVETITVLKDAAAASIWGAQAGNGVIVITTKKGKLNQPLQVAFNSNFTYGTKPDLFYQSRMSTSDYIDIEQQLFREGFYRTTETAPAKTALTPVVEILIARRDGRITEEEANRQITALKAQDVRNDFKKYLYQNSWNRQYNVSLKGGGARQSYYLSTGYDLNQVSLTANSYRRFTLSTSNTYSLLKDRLEITGAINYSHSKRVNDNPGTNLLGLSSSSTAPIYPYARLADENGNPLATIRDYRPSAIQDVQAKGLLNWQYNPLQEIALADNSTRLVDYRFNTTVKYKLNKQLAGMVLYQYSRGGQMGRNLQSIETYYTRNQINRLTKVNPDGSITRPIPLGGILDISDRDYYGQNLRAQLNYDYTHSVHQITAIGGWEFRELNMTSIRSRLYGYDDEHATSKTVDYLSSFPQYLNPASSSSITNYESLGDMTDRYISYYGNAAYTLATKYTISASARIDQSNLFGVRTNQKGVPLWSTGFAWKVHQEKFYDLSWLPFLNVRLTYGFNGNVDRTLSAYTTARYNNGASLLTRQPYADIVNPPNPELKWEKIKIINLGIDFSSKKGVFSGTVDVYSKKGIDLIGNTPYAPSAGITTFRGNYANTRGHGIDISLNTRIIDSRLKWNTIFLFSYVRDRVTHYLTKSAAVRYLLYGQGGEPMEGKPLFSIYSYQWGGLEPTTGDPQGYLNGSISKDYAQIISSATPESIIFNGPARPTCFGALRNSISWKRLSISLNISYRLGYYFRKESVRYYNVLSGTGGHGDYALRWQKPGDELVTQVPSMPAVRNTNRDDFYLYSSHLVAKGDHVRLQDITLNYSFSRVNIPRLPFRTVQLYFYANNLGLLWNNNPWNVDPDYQTGPPPITVAAGLKIDF